MLHVHPWLGLLLRDTTLAMLIGPVIIVVIVVFIVHKAPDVCERVLQVADHVLFFGRL